MFFIQCFQNFFQSMTSFKTSFKTWLLSKPQSHYLRVSAKPAQITEDATKPFASSPASHKTSLNGANYWTNSPVTWWMTIVPEPKDLLTYIISHGFIHPCRLHLFAQSSNWQTTHTARSHTCVFPFLPTPGKSISAILCWRTHTKFQTQVWKTIEQVQMTKVSHEWTCHLISWQLQLIQQKNQLQLPQRELDKLHFLSVHPFCLWSLQNHHAHTSSLLQVLVCHVAKARVICLTKAGWLSQFLIQMSPSMYRTSNTWYMPGQKPSEGLRASKKISAAPIWQCDQVETPRRKVSKSPS